MIVLFFSSHGTPPDKFGAVHLVTYDTDVKPRERVWETSITEGILQQFVQEVRAKRMTVILDACYSNGAYSKVAGFLPPGGKSLGSGDDEGVGLSKQDMARRIFGAKDLVIDGPPVAAGAPKGIIGSGGYGECSSVPVTPESAPGSPRRCTTASSHAMAAVAPVQAGTPPWKAAPPAEASVDASRAEQHVQQGMTYIKMRDYDNAFIEFSRAIELMPTFAVAYADRGIAYMQQGKLNKSMDDLQKAAGLAPGDKSIQTLM